jgi:hypothetical protein
MTTDDRVRVSEPGGHVVGVLAGAGGYHRQPLSVDAVLIQAVEQARQLARVGGPCARGDLSHALRIGERVEGVEEFSGGSTRHGEDSAPCTGFPHMDVQEMSVI